VSDDDLFEPDRVEGAPHPRDTAILRGQSAAETTFLDAYNTGRLHHGWLITGPRGVGKATLAWRIARFLLAQPPADGGLFGAPPPPTSLDVDPSDPTARRIAASSEGRLKLIRRTLDDKTKKPRSVIVVDDVRDLKGFFHMSAADGGRRVVIVDPVDEMNPNAANALLKELEEPPKGATLLLISHQPSRLLPTIHSRCRELRLTTLSPADMAEALAAAGAEGTEHAAALTELAGGSVGEAIRITNLDGLKIYASIIALFTGLPRLDRQRALALADSVTGKANEPRFDLTLTLFDLFLARLSRTGVLGAPPPEASPGESALLPRLAPDAHAARAWADLQQTLGAKARRGKAVNLDPAALLLDMVLRIDETAARLAGR
jgi:DNA polymerase III subunit delta'